MKLQALIIDDEFNASSNLQMMIEEYCPQLDVIGTADSAENGRQQLKKHDVDVVFLDIKMPQEDGFSFLNSLEDRSFSVVFTTAHNEFALKAFRADAIDYLEKPISVEDLQKAVQKVSRLHATGKTNMTEGEALREFLKGLSLFPENEKTSIPTRDGYVVIRNKDIVRLEACDSYTNIYLKDGKRYMSSKNIKVYEDNLNKEMFFRTHKSHIVNTMYHLEAFSRTDGNFAILSDQSSVPVSRRKLQLFLDRIATF